MKIKQFFLCSRRSHCFWGTGLLVFLALAVILWPWCAAGQHPAVPKLTLAQVEQLVSSKVPDSTLSTQIQRRGLSFTPTPAIVESLRAKGAGPQTLLAIEEFFPEAPLAETMRFIQNRLNDLGTVSFTSFFQNTANVTTGNDAFKYEFSNVVADQNQCRVSYHVKIIRNGSTLTEEQYALSLRDVQGIVVKPYTQFQTESNASLGTPNLVCTSSNPPLTMLLVDLPRGAHRYFPFTDTALANRVAKALKHAIKLCGGNNATVPIQNAKPNVQDARVSAPIILYDRDDVQVTAHESVSTLDVTVHSPENVYVSLRVDRNQNGSIDSHVDTGYAMAGFGNICTEYLIDERTRTPCGQFVSAAKLKDMMQDNGRWQYTYELPKRELSINQPSVRMVLDLWNDTAKQMSHFPSDGFQNVINLPLH